MNDETASCEFVAEETLVTIVPNFAHDQLRFVGGNFGPFVPQTAVEVPLWLACVLRRRAMCAVLPPEWLHVDALRARRADEAENVDAFSPMPYHYMEISALLLEAAPADLEAQSGVASVVPVREAIEDIYSARVGKIREGMLSVARQAHNDETTFSVKMNNVGAIEVAGLRKQLVASLERFYALKPGFAPGPGPAKRDRARESSGDAGDKPAAPSSFRTRRFK